MIYPKTNGPLGYFDMKFFKNVIMMVFLFCLTCVGGESFSAESINPSVLGERLVSQGKELEKRGEYEKALKKYHEALTPKFNKFRWEETSARGAIRRLYINWGKYDEAREATKWFTEGKKELKTPTKEIVWEVEALSDYQKTGNPILVIKLIHHLEEEYKEGLPPKNWVGGSDIYISKILRLNNAIGNHDAGIKLIDICLEYFKNWGLKRYAKYQPGKADAAYLKVRQGFEQDKAEGFKGCAGKKSGEVCMGKATKALIDSDYFPW